MPTSKQLSYDHEVYKTPVVFSSSTTVGANGVSQKFAAFTALQLRAAVVVANTVGTSSTLPLIFTKSGTTTTTTTFATGISSAAVTPATLVLATAVSLAQGDQFWVTHGTDATIVGSVAIECYPTPGAAVACP